ncbi:hypothetical protein T310_4000 [Rasamsonia emersonii CBS 393.64]|uniref:Uncharacterized protein n=1 Tax=Rasamsonia emersonii (strain ATCC 16479 / CBS 393.64 / IMI 116815) TaxID=1408163 RepID=A0A0F4YUT0_RASE3|nr:hypothetical protein T310_4000 [Rasamsonia emersonii CBS 393.64]KKA21989.1 hypothetical protein T310_4000 [Rasamsonia emersonii CBS 393.64]
MVHRMVYEYQRKTQEKTLKVYEMVYRVSFSTRAQFNSFKIVVTKILTLGVTLVGVASDLVVIVILTYYLFAQLMEVINNWKAEQQVWEESYLQRISSLELEISKLHTELMATNQQAPISDLPAHLDQVHRPASRAASRAGSNNQIKDQQPKTPIQRPLVALKQLAKKGTSYADVAALMATRPGGQEW